MIHYTPSKTHYFSSPSLTGKEAGFVLPIVLFLGIGMMFMLGSLIERTPASSELLKRNKSEYERIQFEHYAQDTVIDAIQGSVSPTATQLSSQCLADIKSEFTQLADETPISYFSINPMSTGAIEGFSFLTKREGHALDLGEGKKLIATSFDPPEDARSYIIDMWVYFDSPEPGDSTALIKQGENVLVRVRKTGSGLVLTLLNNQRIALSDPAEEQNWHHIVLSKTLSVGSSGSIKTYSLTVNDESPVTQQSNASLVLSPGDSWYFGEGDLPVELASLRAWSKLALSAPNIDGQEAADRGDLSTVAPADMNLRLAFDGRQSLYNNSWQLNVGAFEFDGEILISKFVTDAKSSSGFPPTPTDQFSIYFCNPSPALTSPLVVKRVRNLVNNEVSWQ